MKKKTKHKTIKKKKYKKREKNIEDFRTLNLKVDKFRIEVIHGHILIEQIMNSFLTRYLLRECDFSTIFANLMLEKLPFSGKYQRINTIFNKRTYHPQLKSLFSNFEFKKRKVVGLRLDNGKMLPSKKLIKKLEILNKIRNHLVHQFVLDTSSINELKSFKGSKIDMDLKGDKAKFKEAFDYIMNFFRNIKPNPKRKKLK